jgi:hypothetical protein
MPEGILKTLLKLLILFASLHSLLRVVRVFVVRRRVEFSGHGGLLFRTRIKQVPMFRRQHPGAAFVAEKEERNQAAAVDRLEVHDVRCRRLSARIRGESHLQGATNAVRQVEASSTSGRTNLSAFDQGGGDGAERRSSRRFPGGAPGREVDRSAFGDRFVDPNDREITYNLTWRKIGLTSICSFPCSKLSPHCLRENPATRNELMAG